VALVRSSKNALSSKPARIIGAVIGAKLPLGAGDIAVDVIPAAVVVAAAEVVDGGAVVGLVLAFSIGCATAAMAAAAPRTATANLESILSCGFVVENHRRLEGLKIGSLRVAGWSCGAWECRAVGRSAAHESLLFIRVVYRSTLGRTALLITRKS
jgi:hypothetical protein